MWSEQLERNADTFTTEAVKGEKAALHRVVSTAH